MKLPYELQLLYKTMLSNHRQVTGIKQTDDLIIIRTTHLGSYGFRIEEGGLKEVFIDSSTNQVIPDIGRDNI